MADILPYLPRGLRMLKMSIDKNKYSEENGPAEKRKRPTDNNIRYHDTHETYDENKIYEEYQYSGSSSEGEDPDNAYKVNYESEEDTEDTTKKELMSNVKNILCSQPD